MTTSQDIKTACENYNEKPKDHDAQKALRQALGHLSILIMDGEKIDVARTVSAWAFCEQTGANKVAGGKKADDVLQVATGILPASPYDGRALFEDKTPDGVDYGPVSQERRRWIAFACLTGEPIGTEQEAVDAAAEPTLHMQRIGKKLAEMEAKPTKSADEERLLLDVRLRMQWTRDKVTQPVPVPRPVAFTGGSDLNRPQLRAILQQRLRTSTDLDAWVLDNFPGIYRRYGGGMDRLTRENMLLEGVTSETLTAAMRGYGWV